MEPVPKAGKQMRASKTRRLVLIFLFVCWGIVCQPTTERSNAKQKQTRAGFGTLGKSLS